MSQRQQQKQRQRGLDGCYQSRDYSKASRAPPPSDLSDVRTVDLLSDVGRMPPQLISKKEIDLTHMINSDEELAKRYINYMKVNHPGQLPPQLREQARVLEETQGQQESFRGNPRRMSNTQAQIIEDAQKNLSLLDTACQNYQRAYTEALHWETEIHRLSSMMQTARIIAEVERLGDEPHGD